MNAKREIGKMVIDSQNFPDEIPTLSSGETRTKMKITLRDDRPISNSPRRLSFHEKEFVHAEIDKGSRPWDTLHVGYLGPLERSENGLKYLFEIVDGFTKSHNVKLTHIAI